jgi:4-hydroxy-2-oxoheptanedioate aldolase
MVRTLGLDFVFIDTEHIPLGRETLSWMCQTYRALNLTPLVRISEPDPHLAAMALDGGAGGVIAPYVETAEQVRTLRGAVKLRPLKGKNLKQVLDGNTPLEPDLDTYLAQRNGGSVLAIMVESQPAVDALDDLLAVPDLDAVLIGPHDLSVSLGIPELYRHASFNRCVRAIIRKVREANSGVGIHFSEGLDLEIQWADAGANVILHSSDIVSFTQAMRRELNEIRQALSEETASAPGSGQVVV